MKSIEEQIEALTRLDHLEPAFNDADIKEGWDAVASLCGFEGIGYAKSIHSRRVDDIIKLRATVDLYKNIIEVLLQERKNGPNPK